MKTQLKVFIFAILFIPFLSSCIYNSIEGNGEIVEETREIPEFSKISSSGSFNIYYEYDSISEVKVVSESNIIMYVETAVFNDELVISTPFHVNIRPNETIEVYVKGPEISKMHLSGSGLISTDTISSDLLELSVSGSGDIETYFTGKDLVSKISGSGNMFLYADCKTLETGVSGSGKINIEGKATSAYHSISGSGRMMAYDFTVEEAEIHISGSGELYLNVTELLTAYISGSGNIHYIGDCELDTHNSGSGRLINEN